MKLTPERLAQFDRDGHPFSPEEPQTLLNAVPALCERREFIPCSALQTATVPFDNQIAAA
jgi:hypothetical protein